RVGGACAPPRGGFAPAPAFLIAHLHHLPQHLRQVQVSTAARSRNDGQAAFPSLRVVNWR
ncbi:MAG: hypothetical protein ROW48_00150, partial [Bellilinea sp.]